MSPDANTKEKLPYSPIEEGDYGLVTCMKGRHAGKVMVYDDDETDGVSIIVYSNIFKPYASMRRAWFRAATDEEKTAHANEYIAKQVADAKNGRHVVTDKGATGPRASPARCASSRRRRGRKSIS